MSFVFLSSLHRFSLIRSTFRYSRYVTKSVLKLDTLLKVVMAPEEPAEEFVKHYLLVIPCQSFSDFQKVLDLKVRLWLLFAVHLADSWHAQGVRRIDQNNLLDIFLARTSTATHLLDSSFLSQLDMDPNLQQSVMSPPSSGVNSPLPAMNATNLNIFGGFAGSNAALPLLPSGSRDPSRGGSPFGGAKTGEDRGKEALSEFKRLGARIGLSTRMFTGRESAS